VERSHRIDQEEFYQLLTYKDDVDLEKKMNTWENFYNFDRPHSAHSGKTLYEALKEKLKLKTDCQPRLLTKQLSTSICSTIKRVAIVI
jgi:hypothetical protein